MDTLLLIATWSARTVAALLLLVTALPLARSGAWAVRIWDFPRLQLAAGCVLIIAALAALDRGPGWSGWTLGLAAALALAAAWQTAHVARYSRLWPARAPSTDLRELRLLVVNVDVRNRRRGEAARAIARLDPDLLVLIEVDGAWAEALAGARARYGHRVEAILPDGHGLAVWSRLPLRDPETRFLLTEHRPSLWARVELPNGRSARLVAMHPAPPGLARRHDDDRYDSDVRDAELVVVAKAAAAEDRSGPWIVAGDFNDIAWSHTTRLFERLSGLVDPRVGRGLFNTYHARYPLLRYPVDHVFVSPGFGVGRLERVRTPGSDHFAILADLALLTPAPPDPEADGEDREEAAERVKAGVEDAAEHGEAPPGGRRRAGDGDAIGA